MQPGQHPAGLQNPLLFPPTAFPTNSSLQAQFQNLSSKLLPLPALPPPPINPLQLQSLPQHDDDHSDSASYASELSGFEDDNGGLPQSEIQAMLRSRGGPLVDGHLWIYRGKMNKWAGELKKQSRIQDMKKTSGLIPAAGSPTLPGIPGEHDGDTERRDYWNAKWKHQIY